MSLPYGTEWQGIIQAIKNLHLFINQPDATQITGGTHAVGSLHYAGQAVDWGLVLNGPVSNLWSIYNSVLPYANHPGSPIIELFWDPSGSGWKNGSDIGPIGGHSDHVHIGVAPGVDLAAVMNGAPTVLGGTSLPASGGGVINPQEGVLGHWSPWFDSPPMFATDARIWAPPGTNNNAFLRAFYRLRTADAGTAAGPEMAEQVDLSYYTYLKDSDLHPYDWMAMNLYQGSIEQNPTPTNHGPVHAASCTMTMQGAELWMQQESSIRLTSVDYITHFLPPYPDNISEVLGSAVQGVDFGQIPGTEAWWGSLPDYWSTDAFNVYYPGMANPFIQYESDTGVLSDINYRVLGRGSLTGPFADGVAATFRCVEVVRDIADDGWVRLAEGRTVAYIDVEAGGAGSDGTGSYGFSSLDHVRTVIRPVLPASDNVPGDWSGYGNVGHGPNGDYIPNAFALIPVTLPQPVVGLAVVFDGFAPGAVGGPDLVGLSTWDPLFEGSKAFAGGGTRSSIGSIDFIIYATYTPPRWRYWIPGDPCVRHTGTSMGDLGLGLGSEGANYESLIDVGQAPTTVPNAGG